MASQSFSDRCRRLPGGLAAVLWLLGSRLSCWSRPQISRRGFDPHKKLCWSSPHKDWSTALRAGCAEAPLCCLSLRSRRRRDARRSALWVNAGRGKEATGGKGEAKEGREGRRGWAEGAPSTGTQLEPTALRPWFRLLFLPNYRLIISFRYTSWDNPSKTSYIDWANLYKNRFLLRRDNFIFDQIIFNNFYIVVEGKMAVYPK